MPVKTFGNGGVTVTGNAVMGMRGFYCLQGLQMHAKFGNRFRLTRSATPAVLRVIATEFTGKTYPQSPKGMASALRDMEALFATKDLDEMGETRMVNAAVGGVAADL